MKIWTIQPVYVYDKLREEKVLYTDITKSSCYNFSDFLCNELKKDNIEVDESDFTVFNVAYDWLKDRMSEVIERPSNATYPWWGWYKRNMRNSKPDLRESGYANKGEQLVCMELELEESNVLLSDFDLWHFCISNSFIPDVDNEAEFDAQYDWFESLSKEEQEKEKFKSWETIFDTHLDFRPWHKRGKWVQATFWELRLEDVKKVEYFKAK